MSFVVVKPRSGGSTTVEVILLASLLASAVASGLAVLGSKALRAARSSAPRERDGGDEEREGAKGDERARR